MAIEGSCLCGQVRYRVAGPLFNADHCHCSMCRRQHGAAFATYADFSAGDFCWTEGASRVNIYEIPDGGGWCFCSLCGSTLAGSDNGTITSVTLGTIEGDPGITPRSHIFVDSKAGWHEITDQLPQFAQRSPGALSD